MTDKKPSTADILAMLRKKPVDASAAPAPAVPSEAEAAVEATPPVLAPVVSAAPAAKPKGTSDIMAAIRAKGATPAAAAPVAAASSPPAVAKPKGSADIMASIRAKGATPAAASAPAAAQEATPAAPVAATPVAAGKSPAEMIKAMRATAAQVESGAVATPSAAPAKPKLPTKAAATGSKKQELPRRSFPVVLFAALCVPYYMAWTLLSAIGGLWILGTARFMMPNTVLELPSKFKVGSIGDYPLGTVSEKYKASRAVWIVHTDGYDGQNVIYALLSVCTHLGCTPSWLDTEQKFKCPCHGSGFYINGVNFEGPAPRPLERVGLVLGPDGTLEVDKSLKFQEELGQWNDPKSFVKVG